MVNYYIGADADSKMTERILKKKIISVRKKRILACVFSSTSRLLLGYKVYKGKGQSVILSPG